MGYQDGNMVFGLPAITDSTARTISTNVFDAGSAVKLFAGPDVLKLAFQTAVTAAADPSIRVELVAADNAALTTLPVTLHDTGVIDEAEDGSVLVTTDVVKYFGHVVGQTVAKRYYGLFITLGGTTPDIVAAPKQGFLALDVQTMQDNTRAAVPA
ncbi:MAG: hypothetical protein KAJ55_00935 [Anaerolineales bacterium]|nr:hypothetical protein [Anaerolineales bacterium]